MRKFFKTNKAVAAIEFAILAPVFFLLFMGILEVGLTIFFDSTMNSALRKAARAASTGPTATRTAPMSIIDFRGVLAQYMPGIYREAGPKGMEVYAVEVCDISQLKTKFESIKTGFFATATADSFFSDGQVGSGCFANRSGSIVLYALKYKWGGYSQLMKPFLPANLTAVTIVRNEPY